MESINTINKTLFGAALAVLALAMALPQGSALAKGMDVKTADLCLVDNTPPEPEFGLEAIGTVAPVTDNRSLGGGTSTPWTAWAVSLEGMLTGGYYGVYNDVPPEESPEPCGGDPVYFILTPGGTGFRNSPSTVNPEVGDTVWICRQDDGGPFNLDNPEFDLTAVLKGVLVKGGKQQNKRGRCPD